MWGAFGWDQRQGEEVPLHRTSCEWDEVSKESPLVVTVIREDGNLEIGDQ